MKKLLLGVAVGVLAVGCASSEKQAQNNEALTDQYAKYQIVDQEFDNLATPNDHYDRVAPYEDQVAGSSYIQSISSKEKSNKKPGRQMAVKKTVVDGQGNPMSADEAAPVTDEESLPEEDM